MIELNILKLFVEKRELFDKYSGYLKRMENLNVDINLLHRTIQEYYDKYPEHTYIGEEELTTFYDLIHPQNRKRGDHKELIRRIYAAEVSTDIMTDLVEQLIEQQFADQIIAKLIPVMQGDASNVLHSIQNELDKYKSALRNPPKDTAFLEACTELPYDLIMGKMNMEGAPWHLETLTSILGPLQAGTLGVIYAFVDGGKTSFGLSAARSFAEYYRDTSEKIVYAGNEEPKHRLSQRLVSAFLGKSYIEIAKSMTEAEINNKTAELGWSRVHVVDGAKHIRAIVRLLDEWRPVCLFIDQGTKVDPGQRAEGVAATRLLYNAYRDLAREYECAIICLEQAIGDAENKQWLDLSDIYGSRVAIQGELDYGIGIGKLANQQGRENFRYIRINKNKLKDGVTTAFTTYFDKERCIWKAV